MTQLHDARIRNVECRDIRKPQGSTSLPRLRLVVLASGGGTTFQNIVDRIAAGSLSAEVVLLIASRANVRALDRAHKFGVSSEVIPVKGRSAEEYGAEVFRRCREVRADLVLLAGYMHFLPIPDDFVNRVMNIHPSLIPEFCGKGFYGCHVHEAVLARGAKVTGCTVHFVDNEYDHGPIIVQRTVPVLEGDDADAVAARVFKEECEAYPEAIRLFAEGRLRIEGAVVRVLPAT